MHMKDKWPQGVQASEMNLLKRIFKDYASRILSQGIAGNFLCVYDDSLEVSREYEAE